MDSTTLALLYGFTGLMAIVAPYLLMVFLFAGPWWTPIIGLALFVGILTFLPPPVALVSCYLAAAGIVLTLGWRWWKKRRQAEQQR
ncbi:hypothetical protein [Ferrimonas sp. YFM]|uniref:hypothetical protein n=1 Tax=Ferrimonas sp. YFM TaxID=3028878 RepID=UPI0025747D75|nr:hypothetical protein [Ferrimonas sp. YFM]BDY06446.1 hypothetical protein F0521_34870 [Ferrimonas sp. YFM]